MKYITFTAFIFLFLLTAHESGAATMTLDLPILDINQYQWNVETDGVLTDEEVAHLACEKASQLRQDIACTGCFKHFTSGWSPGTGAYWFSASAAALGHGHSYGFCSGGSEEFIFGYNSDAHYRGGHCMYPTEPGEINWLHSGTYLGCHQANIGSFSISYCDIQINDFTGVDILINPLPLAGQAIDISAAIVADTALQMQWQLIIDGRLVQEGFGLDVLAGWDGRNGAGVIEEGTYEVLLTAGPVSGECTAQVAMQVDLTWNDNCKLQATFSAIE